MKRFVWLIVAAWPLVAVAQTPSPVAAPIPDTLADIKAEAERSRETFRKEIQESDKETPVSELRASVEAFHARLLGLMDRALTLARSSPEVLDAVDAAAWAAAETGWEAGDDIAERGDAAYRLLADSPALEDPELFDKVPDLFKAMDSAETIGPRAPASEAFLRAAVSRNRNRAFVHVARLYLGLHLAEMARVHDRLTAPISGPELANELTNISLERCRAVDGPKFRSEAEALLEQVAREDAELRVGLWRTAEDELHRIRRLRIGQPAPEIVGEDIDGAPIRLSDFRGKIVVLSFWMSSDNWGMKWIPREKDLVAAMKGRPFALVGVNGDAEADRAKVKEVVAKEGITWRSFWAGGSDGEIPRQWSVRSWPSAYLIDADGTILDDLVGENLTPAALQPLVQAAEEAAR